MAQALIKKVFRDIHTKEIYESGKEVTMTVKRINEVIKNLGDEYIERLDTKK